MGRVLAVIWLVLAVLLLVIVSQNLLGLDLPLVRDLPSMLPLLQGTPAASPPSPTVAVAPSASPAAATVQSDVCTAAAPRYVLAMARLQARLGADMGAPTECERVVDASGNTEQKTTTGLAYYRASLNTPVFTNGVEHWALTADGLVHWTSDDLEPPRGAEVQP